MSINVISNFPSGGGNNLKPKITSARYKEIEIGTSLYWSRVAYGNGIFVAFGPDYADGTQKTTDKYIYSTDGVNWIEGTLPRASYYYQVDFIKDRFYITNNFTSGIATSKNGIHWENNIGTQIGAGNIGAMNKIVYGNGIFVAFGTGASSKGYIAYSHNALEWHIVEQAIKDNHLNDVIYGNGMFIATARKENKYIYSYDGKRWKIATLDIDNIYINRSYVAYGSGKFVINVQIVTDVSVETQKNMCFTSEDGLNWKKIELPSFSGISVPVRPRRIDYINGMFFITTNSTYYFYSYDGENWKVSECYYGIDRTNTVTKTL